MVEFVILEPSMARMALSWVAKGGGTKGKNDNDRFTLRISLRKLYASEKVSIVVEVDL